MTDDLFPNARVRCKCGAAEDVAPTTVGTLFNVVFAFLNVLDLVSKGWAHERGRWWCRGCITRRRLVKLVPDDNVTDLPPPTGNHL